MTGPARPARMWAYLTTRFVSADNVCFFRSDPQPSRSTSRSRPTCDVDGQARSAEYARRGARAVLLLRPASPDPGAVAEHARARRLRSCAPQHGYLRRLARCSGQSELAPGTRGTMGRPFRRGDFSRGMHGHAAELDAGPDAGARVCWSPHPVNPDSPAELPPHPPQSLPRAGPQPPRRHRTHAPPHAAYSRSPAPTARGFLRPFAADAQYARAGPVHSRRPRRCRGLLGPEHVWHAVRPDAGGTAAVGLDGGRCVAACSRAGALPLPHGAREGLAGGNGTERGRGECAVCGVYLGVLRGQGGSEHEAAEDEDGIK